MGLRLPFFGASDPVEAALELHLAIRISFFLFSALDCINAMDNDNLWLSSSCQVLSQRRSCLLLLFKRLVLSVVGLHSGEMQNADDLRRLSVKLQTPSESNAGCNFLLPQ